MTPFLKKEYADLSINPGKFHPALMDKSVVAGKYCLHPITSCTNGRNRIAAWSLARDVSLFAEEEDNAIKNAYCHYDFGNLLRRGRFAEPG
jgi:hypothetical protein